MSERSSTPGVRGRPDLFFVFRCSTGHDVQSSNEDIEEGPCSAVFAGGRRCTGTLGEAMVPSWLHHKIVAALSSSDESMPRVEQ